MKTKFLTLTAVAAMTLGFSACTTESTVLNKAPGTYESSTSRTNSNGTDVKQDSTAEVRYDAYGNKEAVVKSKTTTDPEGLFNKSTTTETTKVKENQY